MEDYINEKLDKKCELLTNEDTDWLAKNVLARKGWFTPPFPTEDQLLKILHRLYLKVDYHVDGSMIYFSCVK